jgi:hypothetical protein
MLLLLAFKLDDNLDKSRFPVFTLTASFKYLDNSIAALLASLISLSSNKLEELPGSFATSYKAFSRSFNCAFAELVSAVNASVTFNYLAIYIKNSFLSLFCKIKRKWIRKI